MSGPDSARKALTSVESAYAHSTPCSTADPFLVFLLWLSGHIGSSNLTGRQSK